ERTEVIHYVPDLVGLHAALFAGHLALARVDNRKDFAIGEFFQRSGVAVVAQFEMHVPGEVAIAAALFSMTHCAVGSVLLLSGSQGRGRGLYGIGLLGGLWRGFGISGGLFVGGFSGFLRTGMERQQQDSTSESKFHGRISLTDLARQPCSGLHRGYIGPSCGKYSPARGQ